MKIRSIAVRVMVSLIALISLVAICAGVLLPASASASAAEPGATTVARRSTPSWGAIASQSLGYGYSFNQKTQAAAEQVARAQCERPPERKGTAGTSGASIAPVAPAACEVRTVFDRSCAALVTGNFGEWGTATAGTKEAASKAAIAECNGRLPTEPCKLVVSVCSMN
ncbi:DUF4189 domain-containing protein [Variovorax sp. RHLX14]|uniref:DUF4189 domain-containing protein n=1 Tax=Variovorax sp. RHLX14 TaxID=1259731 RepID=UPI003F45DF0E